MISKKLVHYMIIGCFALGITAPAFSGIFSRTYVFEPGKAKIVANPLLWNLDTLCTIQSKDSSNNLTGIMKKKTGEMNGIHLDQGHSGSVVVKNKEILHITAEVGAQIEITNHGKNIVIAVCKI